MVDLSSVCSLPIQFFNQNQTFVFCEPLSCQDTKKVSLSALVPTLLNKSLRYPEEVYEEHSGVYIRDDCDFFNDGKLQYEVLMLPSGLLGIEFIKSHIYFAPENGPQFSTVVECLYGILTVLIQKNKPKDELDFETSIEEGIMINIRKGERVAIPSGYFYTFINTRTVPVIFSRVYRNKGILDYSVLAREQGLGYFAIRKNARTEIVFNPRYREIPKVKRYPASDERFTTDYSTEPLYQAVKNNKNYFIEMLCEF